MLGQSMKSISDQYEGQLIDSDLFWIRLLSVK